MGKSNRLKLVILIFAAFTIVHSKSVFADICPGNIGTDTWYDPECNSVCAGSPCSPGIPCCLADDNDPELFCCQDPASVPELPSWFGPFFLATLVAGWEYWRNHRRKLLLTSVEKK